MCRSCRFVPEFPLFLVKELTRIGILYAQSFSYVFSSHFDTLKHTGCYIVTWRPKARIVKSEWSFIAKQRLYKHSPLQLIRKQQLTSVAIQRLRRHIFPIIERLCFLSVPSKVLVKESSVETSPVEFRDASRTELGSRRIELSVAE
jgi:hypothetical protein